MAGFSVDPVISKLDSLGSQSSTNGMTMTHTMSGDAAVANLSKKSSKPFTKLIVTFLHPDMSYESVYQIFLLVPLLLFVVIFAVVGICFSAPHMGLAGLTEDGEVRPQHLAQVLLNLALLGMCATALTYLYFAGLTTRLKVFVLSSGLFYCIASSTVWRTAPFQLLLIPLVDFAHILNTTEETKTVGVLATLMVVGQLAFLAVHIFAEVSDGGLVSWHEHEKTYWFGFVSSSMIPPVMCHVVLKSFMAGLKSEQELVFEALDEAHQAAELLANFDLDQAALVLGQNVGPRTSVSSMSSARLSSSSFGVGSMSSDALLPHSSSVSRTSSNVADHVTDPLRKLLSNMRSYKVFLPESLFDKEPHLHEDTPSVGLEKAMSDCCTNWTTLDNMVDSMREPEYSLLDFESDAVASFPELSLYSWQDDLGSSAEKKRTSVWMSSGLAGEQEYQRTMSALFAVYCFCRLDIDGRDVLTFGVDSDGNVCNSPNFESEIPMSHQATGSSAHSSFSRSSTCDRLTTFYDTMAWERAEALMFNAGIFEDWNDKCTLHKPRLKGMLVLTAIHDIMKNTALLPTVQSQHRDYCGYKAGDIINDHDVALGYVLDYFPHMLPSYYGLEPSLRAPILFTQGKMGFNNGWLVQGEAPPGVLFKQFKRIIVQGNASAADVNFYFVHWLTDVAGAEPYGDRPWPGAEKLTIKFPVRVLSAFLDSFNHVNRLAYSTEVEAMESYLEARWEELGPAAPTVCDESYPAAMRLALMAQGFECEAIAELERLPDADKLTLSTELARTGCQEQFRNSPYDMHEDLSLGPVLLVYYAPSLLQKATAAECFEALRVLATVMQAARVLFPLNQKDSEAHVIVRIDALRIFTPATIRLHFWHLKKIGPMEAEVGNGSSLDLLADDTTKENLKRWGNRIWDPRAEQSIAIDTEVAISRSGRDVFAAADLNLVDLSEV